MNAAASRAVNAPLEGDLSLNETAYIRLKNALVTLEYKPGEYLNIAQVMERLGLGRTPIHQALHRLSTEGLIQIIPRKGAMAAPLSINDALELIDVRLVNEMLCVRLAAKLITDAELHELHAVASDFEMAANKQQSTVLMNADRRFHELIAVASRNTILQDILNVLHARSQRFWAISLSSDGHIAEVIAEHCEIVVALERRDGESAAEAVRTHVLSFKASLLRMPTTEGSRPRA